jgi:4-hydroxybenzoate polyprenyltransferase
MHEYLNKLIMLAEKWADHSLKVLQTVLKLLQSGGHIFIRLCGTGLYFTRHYVNKALPLLWTGGRIFFRLCGAGLRRSQQILFNFQKYFRDHWPLIRERLWQYVQLVRLDKPIGIFLLLWPTLWALWIAAEGVPEISILIIFILGVIIMRSAGCVINDLADRNFDPHVARTRDRPVAAGKISIREALLVAFLLISCAFLLVLRLDPLAIKLSFAGAALAVLYPFTKRYTYIPQFFLGLAFGWAVPMAFAAQTSSLPAVAWSLLMATVLWAVVYDTMYAMVDKIDDIRLGLKSTAILFEDADRAIIGIVQVLVLLALALVGNSLEAGWFYYAGLATAGGFSLYQQYLIKDRIPEHCFRAFLNNNWFGATIFAGIFLNYN